MIFTSNVRELSNQKLKKKTLRNASFEFFLLDICAKEEKSQKIYTTTIIIPEGEDDFKQLHEFLCNH